MVKIALVVGVLLVSGCTESVRTYDGNGNLLGSCESERALFYLGTSLCSGSANPKDQRVTPPDASSNTRAHRDLEIAVEAAAHALQQKPPETTVKDAHCADGEAYQYGQCYPIKPALR